MKFFLVFSTLFIASVNCISSIVNTGSSAVTRSEDGYGNYAFGYNEDHATGGTFRKEKGGPGVQVGSYGLRDADGRMRVVNYVADAHGFRASISTNEPGVDPKQDPAAMDINGQGIAAPMVAPIITKTYAAPIIAKSYATPIIAKSYAAPMVQAATIVQAAPMVHAAPVITSSYQTSTQHISAAPMMAKTILAGPIANAAPIASSYHSSTQHVSAVPMITKIAAAPIPATYSIHNFGKGHY